MDIFLVALQLILKDFSTLFLIYCCFFLGVLWVWGVFFGLFFFEKAAFLSASILIILVFFIYGSESFSTAGIHPFVAILLDWSTQIRSLQTFQSWVKVQILILFACRVKLLLFHLQFESNRRGFFFSVALGKRNLWARLARGSCL